MNDDQANYVATNRRIGERLLILLDGRRVLFYDDFREDYEECRKSVHDLRLVLTNEMLLVVGGGSLMDDLRAMRKTCETFVSAAGHDSERFAYDHGLFLHHLHILREVFSQRLGKIVDEFNLIVPSDLQRLLDLTR